LRTQHARLKAHAHAAGKIQTRLNAIAENATGEISILRLDFKHVVVVIVVAGNTNSLTFALGYQNVPNTCIRGNLKIVAI
jgi:hypothetical protein